MQVSIWQQEKKKLARVLEEKIITGQENLTLSQLKKHNVPEVLHVSLQNQATHIFKKERPLSLIQSDRFDFSDTQIKKQLSTLRDLLIEKVQFKTEEVRKAISFSINLAFDVITRPKLTIKSILFQKSSERRREDVLAIIRGLGDDLLTVRTLQEFLEAETVDVITREHFDAIMKEVFQSLYGEQPITALMNDLNRLQHLYQEITGREKEQISAQILYGMIKERDLQDYAPAFKKEMQNKSGWSLTEFEQFLERTILVGNLEPEFEKSDTIFIPEEQEEETRPKQPQTREETGTVPAQQEAEKAEQSQLDRLKNRIRTEQKPEPEKNEYTPMDTNGVVKEPDKFTVPAVKETNGEKGAIKEENKQNNNSKEETDTGLFRRGLRSSRREFTGTSTDVIKRSQIEAQPPGPYPPLHSLIDDRSRKVFVKKLFGKDSEAYHFFVERLERTESWKEAKGILDRELSSRGLSPYSREAVRFSDILFGRYFSKGGY